MGATRTDSRNSVAPRCAIGGFVFLGLDPFWPFQARRGVLGRAWVLEYSLRGCDTLLVGTGINVIHQTALMLLLLTASRNRQRDLPTGSGTDEQIVHIGWALDEATRDGEHQDCLTATLRLPSCPPTLSLQSLLQSGVDVRHQPSHRSCGAHKAMVPGVWVILVADQATHGACTSYGVVRSTMTEVSLLGLCLLRHSASPWLRNR